jgi:hypothetical protein
MRTRHTLLLLPAIFIPLALIAQGPLTPPPGAPVPLMKTLQQVEPRIDVATLPGDATTVFVISAPGSYYLSGNVVVPSGKAGIGIAAAEVALDLNGFAITGAAGSLRGVELYNRSNNVRVHSGTITGFTGGPGVGVVSGTLTNAHFEDITIGNCAGGVILPAFNGVTAKGLRVTGSTSSGLDLGPQAAVTHCVADACAGNSVTAIYGIRAGAVDSCEVTQFSNATGPATGISAVTVSGCNVTLITGSLSGTTGIAAGIVSRCRISTVTNASSGLVSGITGAVRASDCQVEDIGATGPGSPTGINAKNVSGCDITGVGNALSTGPVRGVFALGGAVSQCTLTGLGALQLAQPVTGISTGVAAYCQVLTMYGMRSIHAIDADSASHCFVRNLYHFTGATGSMLGITALRITDCSADTLTANSSSFAACFAGYAHASGCGASNIENLGSGEADGFRASNDAITVHCQVNAAGTFGISAGTGCTVKDCVISMNAGGTGILAFGSGVIDGNAVTLATTGINASGSKCLVVRNRVISCTTNVSASATSQVGPIVTATGPIASANPWANFTD